MKTATELQMKLLLAMNSKAKWYAPATLATKIGAPAGGTGMALRAMARQELLQMKWVQIRAARSVKRGRKYKLAPAGIAARRVALQVDARPLDRS
jgi:hypothetical protein